MEHGPAVLRHKMLLAAAPGASNLLDADENSLCIDSNNLYASPRPLCLPASQHVPLGDRQASVRAPTRAVSFFDRSDTGRHGLTR